MISAWQIRAARGALRWSARDLAQRSGLSWTTIQRIENADSGTPGLVTTLTAIRSALEGAGIVFLDDDGTGRGIRFDDAAGQNR